MNQFKKAKQSTHQTERITDLKTAGVAVVPETTAVPEQKDPIPVKEEAEKNNTAVTVEAPVSEQAASSDDTPEHQVENTSHSTIISNNVPPVQAQEPAPQSIAVQQAPAPVIQTQYQEAVETYSEPVPTRTPKNGKKSAPNMFTQKSESKSIRKSLVLRPSSVRIAENYCAKNGGSFNELIQILLDNFIDEYGL